MDIKDLVELAKKKKAEDDVLKNEPFYLKTIAWFHYLGLLRHNKIEPQRHTVTLAEALKAGKLEPRVMELIPAILVVLPKALKFKKAEIPNDLTALVALIRKRQEPGEFRGVTPEAFLHWLRAPVMDVAKRRIDFHRLPRRRDGETHSIGKVIKDGRLRLSLTQKQLATKYDLSLRIIRDLEQGKMDASLKATNDILQVFGRSIKV